ncbi:hypothetical protein [Marinicrinis sediminis]|uniref:Uncharacterized protein n=1 Tax=Marinicrinis sediminis TaxID=1652465 RepID=A0ABW5RD16_9BACL
MIIKNIEFTAKELEDIYLAKDLCNGMKMDGKKVICFEVLSKLLNGELGANQHSKIYY